jgi:hypothetical protein
MRLRSWKRLGQRFRCVYRVGIVLHDSINKMNAIFLSTHVITSDVTRPMRETVIAALSEKLAPMTAGGKVHLITNHDAGEVRQKLSKMDADTSRSVVTIDPEKMPDAEMRALVHPLHIRVLSNALKHHQAILDVAAASAAASTSASTVSWSLIVEDDAVFNDDQIIDTLRMVVRDAPQDADIVFLGLPSKRAGGNQVAVFDDVSVMVKTQVIPACESYLISAAAAARIADAYLPVRFATNMQLTHLIRSGVIKSAYVAVPNAFVDGSKIGVFTSSLNPNNQLVWSQPYCAMSLHMQNRDTAGFKDVWDAQSVSFKAHPDAMVLFADWHMMCDRPRDAESVYAAAIEQYDANRCIVGASSLFMKRYMAVYADIQDREAGVMSATL